MAASLALFFGLTTHAARADDKPDFGSSFGSVWFDGQAEISTYKYTVKRYGEERLGNAVAIFVTEDFAATTRVKSDKPASTSDDVIPALKLNLVRDFPTGVYDYNTMLSTFVATQNKGAAASGAVLKVSFSSQEWCGHVYHQIIPRGLKLETTLHSYFEGEADQSRSVQIPEGSTFADALFHWARGFARPVVAPGKSHEATLYQGLMDARLHHFEPQFVKATFSVSDRPEVIQVEGNSWATTRKDVRTADGRTFSFWVEKDSPFKLIKWSFTGGTGVDEEAVIHGSKRMPYWSLNTSKGIERLRELGLEPRPRMSP